MNIEQIALEVADELFLGGKAVGNEPAEFLRRCLSKLAEQAGEPAIELFVSQSGIITGTGGKAINLSHGWNKLYTEAQLIAAQQRTAEACAKVCNEIAVTAWGCDSRFAEAIRNNWREYL